jgi:hypothetical protein
LKPYFLSDFSFLLKDFLFLSISSMSFQSINNCLPMIKIEMTCFDYYDFFLSSLIQNLTYIEFFCIIGFLKTNLFHLFFSIFMFYLFYFCILSIQVHLLILVLTIHLVSMLNYRFCYDLIWADCSMELDLPKFYTRFHALLSEKGDYFRTCCWIKKISFNLSWSHNRTAKFIPYLPIIQIK